MKTNPPPVMRGYTHSFFLSIIFLGILLIAGCKKRNAEENTLSKENNYSLSVAAKNYFADLVNAESKSSSSLQSQTPKLTKGQGPRITPLSKMSPYILWDNATEQKENGLDFLAVPLKEDIKPFKNKAYEFFREIFFYQSANHKINMIVAEVLSKKNESLGNDLQKIAITSFENNYFSRAQSIDRLNASVIFYNENYVRDTSFQLQNGLWMPARISFRNDLAITQ